jgi:Xaa-Pro aminopeptidase
MMMSDGSIKLKKAINLLNQKGLDGLIIYSRGTGDISFPRYFQYFSEFKPLSSMNAVIISKTGDVILLIEPRWDSIRAFKKSWISDIRGSSDFLKDLTGIMRQFKITGSVGLVGSRVIRRDLYDCINKEAKVELADDIIEEIAREKTEEELDMIRRTARIADVGFKAFLEHAQVGIKEYELLAETEFAMRSAGADDCFNLLSSGKHNHAMHAPTDRRLRGGDIIIAEITSVFEGNYGHLCRTAVLGRPDTVLTEKYNMLVHALDEALKQIRPGNPASSMSITMNRVIGEAGYAKYCRPPYMRIRGHGFGVGSVAPGTVIDDDTNVNFERHQVIAVHPNQYIPETGYLSCGETVLVMDERVERLTETEAKLYMR